MNHRTLLSFPAAPPLLHPFPSSSPLQKSQPASFRHFLARRCLTSAHLIACNFLATQYDLLELFRIGGDAPHTNYLFMVSPTPQDTTMTS